MLAGKSGVLDVLARTKQTLQDLDQNFGNGLWGAALVAYRLELDVDAYGYLTGGEDLIRVDPTTHRWSTPYPAIDGVMQFSWDPGSEAHRPNVFRHNLLHDIVCDELAPFAGSPGRTCASSAGEISTATSLSWFR